MYSWEEGRQRQVFIGKETKIETTMDEIDLKIKIMVERIMIILTVIIDMWIGRKQSFRYYYVFRQTDKFVCVWSVSKEG